MRILPNKYPEETEIARWLVFDNVAEATISLVFARRLAALARDNKVKIYISEGYRSTERQKYFYDLYLAGKGNLAAKPGTSLHEFHVAVDIGDPKNFWKIKSNNEWIPFSKFSQVSLNKYGLCLPLNGKEKSATEWWHITPIEFYKGYSGTLGDFLQPDDKLVNLEEETKRVQEIDYIMNKFSYKLSKPDYWQNVLEGKVTVNVDWLRALMIRLLEQ